MESGGVDGEFGGFETTTANKRAFPAEIIEHNCLVAVRAFEARI